VSEAAPESERQRRYREDTRLLGELGGVLAHTDLPRIEVRLPRRLAERAVAAWERDDSEGVDPETFEQRVERHRAGTLGLIGLSIANGGRWEADEVVVELDPTLIGVALDASEYLPPR
jgi:hypothetical protein